MPKGGQLAREARILCIDFDSKLIRFVWYATDLLPEVSLHEYPLLWSLLRASSTRKYHKQCFKELVPCVIYFDVPYEDREKAKSLGARFDFEVKAWYAPNTTVAALLHTFEFERKFI